MSKAPMRIGDWTVTPELNQLERYGVATKIEPRAMDLLVYLARTHGRVVSADELLREVWHGRVFDDGIVYKKINQLRNALGDDGNGTRFIETIPKRGYRLVVAVSPAVADAEAAAQSTAPGTRSKAVYAAGLLSVAIIGLIAVWQPGTPPGPAITPLTFDGGMKGRPRLSPNGQLVAFTWGGPDGANADIYVQQIGRNTLPIRITDHPHIDAEVSWSPDGKQLVFLRDEEGGLSVHGGRLSIYVVPSLGGSAKKVTDFATLPIYVSLLGAVSWSPRGPLIVYAERPAPGALSQIVELDLNTGHKRALSDPSFVGEAVGDYEPVFSPLGDKIAFVRGAASFGDVDLWVMDAGGGNERRVTNDRWSRAHSLSWAEDGESLVFTAGSVNMRSYSVRLDEGIAQPLPGLGANDISANTAAGRLVFTKLDSDLLRMWQAPGRSTIDRGAARELAREGIKLVYSVAGDRIAWQSHRTGRAQVWIANADGTAARILTDQKTDAFNPQWAPDGTRIVFHSKDAGTNDVWIIDVATARARTLTSDPGEERYPTFSRDGRSIYFASDRSGRSEIYRMPVDGGEAALVTDGGGTIGFESHDGRYLYYEHLDGNGGYTTVTPVWRMPVDGSAPRGAVLPGWQRIENSWVLSRDGIYYLQNSADSFSIRYHDLTSGADSELYAGAGQALYPGVSADESAIFFSRDLVRTGELWLVDPFP